MRKLIMNGLAAAIVAIGLIATATPASAACWWNGWGWACSPGWGLGIGLGDGDGDGTVPGDGDGTVPGAGITTVGVGIEAGAGTVGKPTRLFQAVSLMTKSASRAPHSVQRSRHCIPASCRGGPASKT